MINSELSYGMRLGSLNFVG